MGSPIEGVEAVLVDGGWRSFVFVQVRTEDGATGLG